MILQTRKKYKMMAEKLYSHDSKHVYHCRDYTTIKYNAPCGRYAIELETSLPFHSFLLSVVDYHCISIILIIIPRKFFII